MQQTQNDSPKLLTTSPPPLIYHSYHMIDIIKKAKETQDVAFSRLLNNNNYKIYPFIIPILLTSHKFSFISHRVNRIPWKTLRNGGSLICVLSACQGLSHLKAFSQNVVETSLPIAADVLALVSALSRFVLDQRLAADPQVSWNLTSAKVKYDHIVYNI